MRASARRPRRPDPAGADAARGRPRRRRPGAAAASRSRTRSARPPIPRSIERGSTLYGINCRLCHGPDLRGGDMGGINLLRSQLVLNDQDGELIFPVVRDGRNNPGHAADAAAAAAGRRRQGDRRLHPQRHGQGRRARADRRRARRSCSTSSSATPPRGRSTSPRIARAVTRPTGDLQGLASRYRRADAAAERLGRRARRRRPRRTRRRGAAPARAPKPVTVAVTTATGSASKGGSIASTTSS